MIGPSSSHAALLKRQRRQERRDQFDYPTARQNVMETAFAAVLAVTLGSLIAGGLTLSACESLSV